MDAGPRVYEHRRRLRAAVQSPSSPSLIVVESSWNWSFRIILWHKFGPGEIALNIDLGTGVSRGLRRLRYKMTKRHGVLEGSGLEVGLWKCSRWFQCDNYSWCSTSAVSVG